MDSTRNDDLPWLAKLEDIMIRVSEVRGKIQYKHNKMWGKSFCKRIKLFYDIYKLKKIERRLIKEAKEHITAIKNRNRKNEKDKIVL